MHFVNLKPDILLYHQSFFYIDRVKEKFGVVRSNFCYNFVHNPMICLAGQAPTSRAACHWDPRQDYEWTSILRIHLSLIFSRVQSERCQEWSPACWLRPQPCQSLGSRSGGCVVWVQWVSQLGDANTPASNIKQRIFKILFTKFSLYIYQIVYV